MVNKENYAEVIENLQLELRRGAMVLAVLSQLQESEYGYSLKQQLAVGGLEIPEGTLYPLLRRLEKQGLLQSEWRVVDEARPRRYYKASERGVQALRDLGQEWKQLSEAINNFSNERFTRSNS
jgi:DNA-binding PadR family transcriptional regulator